MSTTKRKTTKPTESSHDWLLTFGVVVVSSALFWIGSYQLGKSEWRNANKPEPVKIPKHSSLGYSYTNNVPKDHILQSTDSGLFRCVTEEDLKWENRMANYGFKTLFSPNGEKVHGREGGGETPGFETRQEAIAAAWKHIAWCSDLSARNAREEVYLRYAQDDTFKSLVNNEQMVSSLFVTSNGVLEAASKATKSDAENIVIGPTRGTYYITTTNIIFR